MFFICSGVAAIVGTVVWSIAWRVGFGEGRLTIPLQLVHAIAEHEVLCRDGDADEVIRALCHDLLLPERECRRLVASKLRSVVRSPAVTTRRSA